MTEELSFEGRIVKAQEAEGIDTAFIYGESGIGKTWFAASAAEIPAFSPLLILDVEGSTTGLARKYPDVDVLKINTHEQLELVLDELLTKEHKYQCVVVDTFNVAQDRAEEFFSLKPENQNNKFGTYRDLKAWSTRRIRQLHAAPFLSIVLMHEKADKDERTGRILNTFKITGGAVQELPTIADVIGHMRVIDTDEGEKVALVVNKVSGYVTKNRFGIREPIIPDAGQFAPTMLDLGNAIMHANNEKEEEE